MDILPGSRRTFIDFARSPTRRAKKADDVYVGKIMSLCTISWREFLTEGVGERTPRTSGDGDESVGDRDDRNDGRRCPEELGRVLGVQFTPTLLFFDEAGKVVVRLDGYYPPQQFAAVLDYVAAKEESRQSLGDYIARHARPKANAKLHGQPFFMAAPYDLVRRPGDKPLAVLVRNRGLHGVRRDAREASAARTCSTRCAASMWFAFRLPPRRRGHACGSKTTAHAWGRELRVAYAPAVVFFDANGVEVFRMGAYLRPFHFASSFAYVADRVYVQEPSLQRYLQSRTDRMRARGQRVELWK